MMIWICVGCRCSCRYPWRRPAASAADSRYGPPPPSQSSHRPADRPKISPEHFKSRLKNFAKPSWEGGIIIYLWGASGHGWIQLPPLKQKLISNISRKLALPVYIESNLFKNKLKAINKILNGKKTTFAKKFKIIWIFRLRLTVKCVFYNLFLQ